MLRSQAGRCGCRAPGQSALLAAGHSMASSHQLRRTFPPALAPFIRARCGWREAEAGSKGGLCLSSALSYALPSTGGCRPFPGQDGGCRNMESRAKGDMSSPQPCRPRQLAQEQRRLAAPARASRKDLVVLFRTRVLQLFQVNGLFFFFLAFTLRLPQKLAVPSTLQEPASPCPATLLVTHQQSQRSPPLVMGHTASPGPEVITHPHGPKLALSPSPLPPSCHTRTRPLQQTLQQAEQGRKRV